MYDLSESSQISISGPFRKLIFCNPAKERAQASEAIHAQREARVRPQMLLLQLFPSLPLEALLDSLYAHGIHQSPKELLDSYLWDLLGALWLYPLPRRLAWSVDCFTGLGTFFCRITKVSTQQIFIIIIISLHTYL